MWNEIINKEKKKPYYQELMNFLDNEYKEKQIFPEKDRMFEAFDLCPFENVKVVIIGQDPYHDDHQAHGLAFSVQKGVKIPPSLRNIYKELNSDIGFDIPTHGYLQSWAEQGVLLMNTILTVEAHKPLSHKNKGWEIFTDHILQELNKDDKPKIFVLWGAKAIKKEVLINNPKHYVIKTSHPSPLSARHSFFGSKMFSEINNVLSSNGRKPIDYRIKNDE